MSALLDHQCARWLPGWHRGQVKTRRPPRTRPRLLVAYSWAWQTRGFSEEYSQQNRTSRAFPLLGLLPSMQQAVQVIKSRLLQHSPLQGYPPPSPAQHRTNTSKGRRATIIRLPIINPIKCQNILLFVLTAGW